MIDRNLPEAWACSSQPCVKVTILNFTTFSQVFGVQLLGDPGENPGSTLELADSLMPLHVTPE